MVDCDVNKSHKIGLFVFCLFVDCLCLFFGCLFFVCFFQATFLHQAFPDVILNQLQFHQDFS